MTKSIIKEIIIMLLLCLAIIIILGLLLYDYVPMSKVIPEPVSYTTPEDIKQELIEVGDVNEDSIIMTYEVDSTDLNNYKNINNYKPGKANPFSSYKQEAATNTTTNNSGTNASTTTNNSQVQNGNAKNNSNSNNNNNNNNNNDNNNNSGNNSSNTEDTTTSGGQFFQDKGTK